MVPGRAGRAGNCTTHGNRVRSLAVGWVTLSGDTHTAGTRLRPLGYPTDCPSKGVEPIGAQHAEVSTIATLGTGAGDVAPRSTVRDREVRLSRAYCSSRIEDSRSLPRSAVRCARPQSAVRVCGVHNMRCLFIDRSRPAPAGALRCHVGTPLRRGASTGRYCVPSGETNAPRTGVQCMLWPWHSCLEILGKGLDVICSRWLGKCHVVT